MKEKYIDECRVIKQNATYSAEAHHGLARTARAVAIWLEVVPAVCAALTGALVAAGIASNSLLPVTILSATVSAIAGVLNPNRRAQEHLAAAKGFTALKHDARFLSESQATAMSDDAFAVAVQTLHDKYNDFLRAVPATSPRAFDKARKAIQSGIHEPDRDAAGQID